MNVNVKQENPTVREATGVETTEDRPVYVPATDIYEKQNEILVVCDMPGVDEQHVQVTLDDGVLTLEGQQQVEAPAGHEVVGWGFIPGVFRRSFRLSAEIAADQIRARLSDGVLHVTLPKAEKARPRTIRVEGAGT